MKKRIVTSSFDELIKNHYGGCGHKSTSNAVNAEKLFASYYGAPATRKEKKKKKNKQQQSAVVMSLSYDDGEMLQQQQNGEAFEEYVVQQSVGDEAFEEYVVEGASAAAGAEESAPLSWQSSYEPPQYEAASDVSPAEECQVDIFPPPKKSNIPGSKATMPEAASSQPAYQQSWQDTSNQQDFISQSQSTDEETGRAKAAEDDFIADMQSILSGQKVFDPASKKMVDKDKLGQQQSRQNDGPPVPEERNGQAIFDRIAQSMQYATAYDLGTVELENRFSDFDRMSELQQKAEKEKKAAARQTPGQTMPGVPSTLPTVDSADFIRDLDAIRQGHYGTGAPTGVAFSSSMALDAETASRPSDPACTVWALSLTAYDNPHEYSRPLYDTGEHVQTGWDLYTDQLRVGQSPGVMFSYGELIAMPDLYKSVNTMMGAEVSELQQLKTLIQRSTAHYKGRGAKDVSESEWEKATNERYLELAEENFEHFSPDTLFKDMAFAQSIGWRGNNQTAWERHHKFAIEEAQKIFLAHNEPSTPFPEWPLIINAFGDHFLTDAFASGHVVNKEAIIEYFKHNFLNGNKLKPEAETFFEKVAKLAFKGEVERKFSVLEIVKTKYGVHWNISSASRFATLLQEIAKAKPDQIGNLALKGLHDRLNRDGIEVTNDAGDGVWQLTGDGTMDAKNLGIIKKAVQQSVDNINDPSIRGSNLDFGIYFSKVWKYVPKLTPASVQRVKQLAKEYTSPDSDLLVRTAAKLITEQVDLLISKLIKAKELQHE